MAPPVYPPPMRPLPPIPPPCRVQCACGKTIPEDVWKASHTKCAARAQRIGTVYVVVILLLVFGGALAANPTIPWPWNQ